MPDRPGAPQGAASAPDTHNAIPLAAALSRLTANARVKASAIAVALVSLAFFVVAVPFAKVAMPVMPAFIAIAQTALIVNDVVTATLLFGQLRLDRSRALLIIACAYVYTALMSFFHMLTFPGLFSERGLLDAGAQTTAYLFIFWHTGLPVAVLAYVAAKTAGKGAVQASHVVAGLGGVALLVAALVSLAIFGSDLLPPLLRGNQYTAALDIGRLGPWSLTAIAAVVLWRSKPRSVLDLWLLVVLCAWFFEIGLVAIFNAGRYDVGFYAGRVYGLLASLFILVVLLTEQARVYSALVSAQQTAKSEAELRESREVLRLAMQGGRMGAWSRDMVRNVVWWSHELEEIFGLAPGSFSGSHDAFSALVHPDDRGMLRRAVDEAIRDHADYAIEFQFLHSSGEWRWMDGRGRAVYDANGEPVMLFGIGIDITARKQGEKDAVEIESRFRTLADGMPQLAWMARPDGWIYWYNRRWYEYTGTTPADMEGWRWQSVHDPKMLPVVIERWQHSIGSGEPFEMVFPLRGADGQFRPFLTRVSPLTDDNGNVMHWFGTNTDITDQRAAEEALRVSDRRKDEFLATLAHELRNPLAPIRNAVEILRRAGPLPHGLDVACGILDRQSRHLARLVDDVLDVARITQGKVQLRIARIALLDPLNDAAEAARPSLEAAGQRISIDAPSGPLVVDADFTRLTQIFLNVLNNAVKFTPRGGLIFVTVRGENGVVVIRIRDTGAGIDRQNLDKVFEMFSQVSLPLGHTQAGLGLGLTLVRGLIELHHGTVEAQSPGLGQGSEFIIRLPLVSEITVAPEVAVARLATGQGARKRVLVVDDNRDAATSLNQLLTSMGHEVREAHDGLDGVRVALEFEPDLVLLDLGMPRMSGYDAVREIRKHASGRDICIFALTGWGQESDKERTREAGFDGHITKPVDIAMLELLLANAPADA